MSGTPPVGSPPGTPPVGSPPDAAAADHLADLLSASLALADASGSAAASASGREADADDLDDARSLVKKTLVLLDFNGLLVCRDTKGDVPSRYRPNFSHFYPKGVGQKICDAKYSQHAGDATQARFHVRRDAFPLVCHLLNDPLCEVAIYSSIYKRNLIPAIKEFDKFNEKAHQGKLVGPGGRWDPGSDSISLSDEIEGGGVKFYSAEFNAPDPEGENHWDTKRDLNRVWSYDPGSGFDKTNTVLIETEERKARDWADVSIIPPEYGPADVVRDHTRGRDPSEPSELEKVLKYLDGTLFPKMQEEGATVAGILRDHPVYA